MRILVCGDKHFDDYTYMWKVLQCFFSGVGDTLIHGCAKGADQLSETVIASQFPLLGNMVSIERYPANWDKYGKAAGPIRNKQMLDEGKPDLIIAFLSCKSVGTANMIQQGLKAGVSVVQIPIGNWREKDIKW